MTPTTSQPDYYKKPHRLRRLKFVLSILAAAGAGAWLTLDALKGDKELYNPNKVAAAHALIEDNCTSCHSGQEGATFLRTVTDHACEACHAAPIHHGNQIFMGRTGAQPTCASCHKEHEGGAASASLVRDSQCTQCHNDLTKAASGKLNFAATITSFGKDHPDFRVVAENRRDTAAIKLNHQKHLRPNLPGADNRPVQMQCVDCHRMEKNGIPAPIDFEQHCQSCHPLAFDERIREPAPHEEPVIVEAFIRTAFSKYAGRNPDEWSKDVDFHPARNLAALKRMVDEAPRNLPEWVEARIAAARRFVIGKRCQECHIVQNAGAVLPTIVKSDIPALWFSHAHFTHEPHRTEQCGNCHRDVSNSSMTSDVLLPSRSTCLQCHKPSGSPTACIACHTYHDKSKPVSYREH